MEVIKVSINTWVDKEDVVCVYDGLLFNQKKNVVQTVKRPPAMRETLVRFLGLEDPLEKEMAIHSSLLAWRIPWTEESGGLVHGVAKTWTQLSN